LLRPISTPEKRFLPLEEPVLTADSLLFGLASLLVVFSALMVVLTRHPVYSALFLVLTFVGLSVFFLQLSAPFLAAVQVIVYAGAIMVLFVFVIMLLGEDKPIPSEAKMSSPMPLGIVFGLVTVLMLGYLMSSPSPSNVKPGKPQQVQVITPAGEQPIQAEFGSVQAIGNTLFTQYLFAFEATSVVLLVAMVGVVVLAKKRL
jgi:NADH-quinone oxidoreductase subunit J